MKMSGKGDKPRPMNVPQGVYEKNFDRIDWGRKEDRHELFKPDPSRGIIEVTEPVYFPPKYK
jgi:hypothetical protein